jgi:hypothetical protein
MKVIFKPSTNAKKKMMAIFYEKGKDGKLKKKKTTHFGAKGYVDYTAGATKEQRARYIKRHTNSREKHNNPLTAGSLSRFVLWGDSTSKQSNIRAFKKRFNLS